MLWGAISFAMMGAMTHALGTRCDWVAIALVRAGFMYVSIVVVARASQVELVVWRPCVLWVRSLSGTLSLFCSFYALTRLPVAEVLTLTNTYPIWIILMSWGAFGVRPVRQDLLAVGCAMLGVLLIEHPRIGHDHTAALIALLSAVFASIAMLGLHRLKSIDPRAVVAHFGGVASIVAAGVLAWRSATALTGPVVISSKGPVMMAAVPGTSAGGLSHGLLSLDPGTLLLLLGVGLAGTVGQVFLTRSYAAGVPTEVAVIGLTQVIFGLIFDVVLWGRLLPPAAILGMILILAPSAWINVRRRGR